MPHKYLFANWKNRLSIAQSVELAKRVVTFLDQRELSFQLMLCPTFGALSEVQKILKGTGIALGGQNLIWNDKFTFTGETSPELLVEIGCKYVIIGHSERRIHIHETDELVNRKVKASLEYGLIPVICVGEQLKDRDHREEIISNQLLRALEGLPGFENSVNEPLLIAYEPAWAISTSSVAIPLPAVEANIIHRQIREVLESRFPSSVVSKIPILYGGSMSSINIHEYLIQDQIDGGLVGSASQDAGRFLQIIEIANQIYSSQVTP